MAENLEGWKLTECDKAIEFIPEKEYAQLKFNFIDKTAVISKPFKIQFMYEATPVKDRPKEWREIRLLHESGYQLKTNTYHANLDWNLSCDWPAASYSAKPAPDGKFISWKEVFMNRKQDNLARKLKKLFGIRYGTYTGMAEKGASFKKYPPAVSVEEFVRYRDEWESIPGRIVRGASSNSLWHSERVCPGSKSYRDFWVWQIVNIIINPEIFDYDGVYFDNYGMINCSHREHGCGWEDEDGNWRPTETILSLRELSKRIYKAVKLKKPDAILMGHSSGGINMAFSAFMDLSLDGENFRGTKLTSKTGHYTEVFPLDYARCEYTGKQFGFIPMHCAEVGYQITGNVQHYRVPDTEEFKHKNYRGTRELMAILLLHDSLLIHGFYDKTAVREPYNAYDRFGIGEEDVVFAGYWEAGDEIKCSNDKIKISYYKRSGKMAMLIISNLTPDNQEFTITIDPRKMGLPSKDLIAIDGEPAGEASPLPDFDGRNLKISVRDYDYKYIIIGGQEDMREAMKSLGR